MSGAKRLCQGDSNLRRGSEIYPGAHYCSYGCGNRLAECKCPGGPDTWPVKDAMAQDIGDLHLDVQLAELVCGSCGEAWVADLAPVLWEAELDARRANAPAAFHDMAPGPKPVRKHRLYCRVCGRPSVHVLGYNNLCTNAFVHNLRSRIDLSSPLEDIAPIEPVVTV